MNSVKLQQTTIEELVEISLRSSKAKDGKIFIYEKKDLNSIIGEANAERIRESFLKNRIKVHQITNNPELPAFTENDIFVNECMMFRYIPKELFQIDNEILIFDDTVAIYNIAKKPELLLIENASFAKNQKALFNNLWEQGQPPALGFAYKPNHSFYNSIDFHINNKQIIVWPDADAKGAYKGMTFNDMQKYLAEILEANSKFFDKSDYVVAFIWNYEGDKMIDMWKFDTNYVDDRSGPLSEVKVFRNQEKCNDLGLASGNTLLVLGYEEKLRRQSKDLEGYLKGNPPKLPLELYNGQEFFN